MSLPAVSKHLKVLERAGLIARAGSAQWRPARLEAGPLKEVAEWSGALPPSSGRRATTGSTSTWTSSRTRKGEGRWPQAIANSSPSPRQTDREIVMTRVFDAPRDLVFEAHTSCEHMSHWWGPRRYEISSCEIDFRPGGAWRIVQRGPRARSRVPRRVPGDRPPERIVWTFEYEGMPGHVSVQTLTFEEHDGKTTLTTVVLFDSIEDRDGMIDSGMESGAAETMDRLEEYLQELRSRTS